MYTYVQQNVYITKYIWSETEQFARTRLPDLLLTYQWHINANRVKNQYHLETY